MSDLTLDQVKAAGRFAVNDNELFTAEYRDGECVVTSLDASRAVGADGMVHADGFLALQAAFRSGWRHLPGCDCEFCRP